jgi:hypothetical protein
MSRPGYHTFDVTFEHSTRTSDTVRQNRVVVAVWGDSEFAIKREIERQYPQFIDVVILEAEAR